MAEIKCPMCSKPNPEELDVCQYCEARLKPLTDELSRSQPPIHPGDAPKEIDTSQLEPVLPQWLREVRQQSRDSFKEEPEQAPVEEEALQPEESANLLAGLQSQAEDDEEVPDWLSGLRGDGVQATPAESSMEEGDDLAALKRMLGEGASEVGESEADELPGWISNLGASQAEERVDEGGLPGLLARDKAEEEPDQSEAQPAASGSDFEWGADFEADSGLQVESVDDTEPIDSELPDWLKGADEEAVSDQLESSLPDWMGMEETAQAVPSPDSEESAKPFPQHEEPQPASEDDMPDWLASLGEETAETAPQEVAQPIAESDTPDWLASLGGETDEPTPEEEIQPAAEGDMPDWLSSLGADSTEVLPQQETEEPLAEGEIPDWLSSMGEETTELEGTPEDAEISAWVTEESTREEELPVPPTGYEETSLRTEDVDALFSVDMPEWLSDAGSQEAEGEALAAPAEEGVEELRPAELPSWVQAMRPVEAVISETEWRTAADQPIEEAGPLAGLQGVLPAVPGVGPSSKPETYSIKLQASEEQQSSVAMLEQMLSDEVQPKPIATQPVMLSQRFLRWVIAIVLLLVVGGSIFSGSQMNPLPSNVYPATKAFLEDYVQGNLPTDAPILLIFDYDAALAGELEAAAAPLIDYMILKKAPRLSLISSTPIGPGLAEQFMSLENTQASLYYKSGQQFINLGYLPGGAAGVLAFAENPTTTKPSSINGENAWETPVLQGASSLSDFATIILLTDNVESARIWIEQTEARRGDARFLVVSSAQSGPMILPYQQSGQIDVMLTGLDSGAPIEQFNGERPGTARRYWDAYGMGLLTALLMISFGSLWSLVAGLRERRREQGEI